MVYDTGRGAPPWLDIAACQLRGYLQHHLQDTSKHLRVVAVNVGQRAGLNFAGIIALALVMFALMPCLFLVTFYICNHLQEGQRPAPWLCQCCYTRVRPAPCKSGSFESVVVDGADSSGSERLSGTLTRTHPSLGALSRTGRSSSTSSSMKGLSTTAELANTGELLEELGEVSGEEGWVMAKGDGGGRGRGRSGDDSVVTVISLEGGGEGEEAGGEGDGQGARHRRTRGGSGGGGSGGPLPVPIVAMEYLSRAGSFPLKAASPVNQRPGVSPRPGALSLGHVHKYGSFPHPGPLASPRGGGEHRRGGSGTPRGGGERGEGQGGQLRRHNSGSGLYAMDL